MVKPITWETIQVRLGDLEEWEKNPAKISPRDARELRASIKRFGFVLPFVAAAPPNGSKKIPLADGHQRKTVSLQLLELAPETFVDIRIPSRKLSEEERSELAIRLRKNVGEWDEEKLREFFEKDYLLEWGFEEADLEEMGFEILEEESKDAEPQIDKAEELLKKWKVKTGDIWELGPHRLICGDCTDRGVVGRVMGGEKARLIPTSPPYFVGKDYEKDVNWDDFKRLVDNFIKVAFDFLIDGGYLFINFSENTNKPVAMAEFYRCSAVTHGLIWHSHRVWKRPASLPIYASTSPRPVGEIEYLHTYRKGRGREKMRDISISLKMLWETRGPERLGHDAAFPAELIEKPIIIYTDSGDLIYEPFLGSGTTLIASHNLGRICRAVEISPAYVAVALQRFEDAFGIKPTLLERANGKK